MKNFAVVAFLMVLTLSGCMLGPDFKKVEIESPDKYHLSQQKLDTTLNLDWWDLFKDKTLVSLIDSALANNKNILMAASSVEQSRIYLGYTKADAYPTLSYSAGAGYGNESGRMTNGYAPYGTAVVNLNWEIDFWGKFRRANESARAELLASEYALEMIQISIVSEVSSAYYILLDYNRRLEIAERTLESRKESTRIINERYSKGTVPELDLNQAQIQEAFAAASIPQYERAIANAENALRVLTGEAPSAISIESKIEDIATPPQIPVGLPSQLLTRRPDLLIAEQDVVAQNARIGVAQAMRFPSISLTAMAGAVSPDLTNFNSTDDIIATAGAGLFGPIFNYGKNKRRVELEEERTNQLKLNYELSVLNAFREVEDALIAVSSLEDELKTVDEQLRAATNAAKLSRARYNGGVTSYLEVLDAERSLFQVELYHSDLMQRNLSSYTQLYKALGGGWKVSE